ncbi:MAG: hypothetical protein PVI21_04935 [Candidatus Woesebacteria bacterium]|jgi:hypothetical protein
MFSPLQLKLNQQVAHARLRGLDVCATFNDDDVVKVIEYVQKHHPRITTNTDWIKARAVELCNLRRLRDANTWLPTVGMLECQDILRTEGFYVPPGQRISINTPQDLPQGNALVPVIFPQGWILQPIFDWPSKAPYATRAILGDPGWNARMIVDYAFLSAESIRASIAAICKK